MKKIVKSNIYFVFILLAEIFLAGYLQYGLVAVGITDVRLRLFLAHTILFLLPAILFVFITKNKFKEVFRLNKISLKQIGILILITIACRPIMTACSAISVLFFPNSVGNFMTSISNTPFIILFLLIAVMPAITEEVTLRGVVLSGYDDYPIVFSCIVNGILFGIFHLDLQQFLYAAVLGMVLAYVVRITNSIYSSMIIHFITNGISVVLQKIIYTFYPKALETSSSVDMASLDIMVKAQYIISYLLIAALFGAIVVLLLRWLKKNSK